VVYNFYTNSIIIKMSTRESPAGSGSHHSPAANDKSPSPARSRSREYSRSRSPAHIMTDPRYEMQKPTNGYNSSPKKPQTVFTNPTLVTDSEEKNGVADSKN